MMNVIDDVADLLERFRRWNRAQWVLRGVMLAGAVVSLLTLWLASPSWLLAIFAGIALLISLLFPRGHVVTIFLLLLVVWAAWAAPVAPWVYGIVAVGAVTTHWAAGACAVGPSFAEVDPAVWKRFAKPLVYAVAVVVAAVVVATLLGLVELPGSLVLVILSVIALIVGAGIVLWPRVRSS